MKTFKIRYLIAVMLIAITAIVVHLLQYDSQYNNTAAIEAINKIPLRVASWTGHDVHLDNRIYEILDTKAIIHRAYVSDKGDEVFLSIVHYADTKVDFHAPEGCLGGRGIEAEKSMFLASKGANTHKGLIFSLGLLCTATAYSIKNRKTINAEQVCKIASEMCLGIVNKELVQTNRKKTIGEKLYIQSGIKGIRGEAESGFKSVINVGLPYLRKSTGDWNCRMINTLLHLMTVVEDSNILGRHNHKILSDVKILAKEVLDAGGSSDDRGMEILRQMDFNFIDKRISPGGCADLLAVTIFLYRIEIYLATEKYND